MRIDLFQVRRSSAAAWTARNDVLAAGEQGYETDSGRMKIGDGVTAWTSLGYLTGDGGAAVETAYSTVIPLDGDKVMPSTTLSADTTFTLGAAPVADGSCQLVLVADGSHTPTFPTDWVNGNSYSYVTTSGTQNYYVFGYLASSLGGKVLYAGVNLGVVVVPPPPDTTPPTLVSAIVADADPTRINLTWSEAINSTVSAATAFAVSSGHPLTSHTYDTATTSHLITSTPFVPGETRTLSYTQPGSNPIQDLSGNLLVTFTGAAITDNVVAPTLVSATVANSTPTRIDLVWSKSMNSTVSASSAFAVSSGHTLTSHTYDTATTSHLITSAAFVASETVTLSYTQPGSNKMQDANGTLLANFSSFAITDNVVGSAQLTGSYQTIGSALNLTTGGFRDYLWTRQSTGPNLQKTAQPFIGAEVRTNLGYNVAGGTWPALTVTDSVNAGTGVPVGSYGPASDAQLYYQAATGAWSYAVPVPANTTLQTVRVHFGGKRDDSFSINGQTTLTATLSDGSAGPLTVTTSTPSADLQTDSYRYDIVFRAGSAGQTLNLTFTGGFIAVQLIALV